MDFPMPDSSADETSVQIYGNRDIPQCEDLQTWFFDAGAPQCLVQPQACFAAPSLDCSFQRTSDTQIKRDFSGSQFCQRPRGGLDAAVGWPDFGYVQEDVSTWAAPRSFPGYDFTGFFSSYSPPSCDISNEGGREIANQQHQFSWSEATNEPANLEGGFPFRSALRNRISPGNDFEASRDLDSEVGLEEDCKASVTDDGGPSPTARGTTAVDVEGSQPYSKLIHRCLLQAPDRTLKLQEIYEWFARNTEKGKDPHRKGWQNSIRHNLSMNGAFEKVGRAKERSCWRLSRTALEEGVQSTTRYRRNPQHGRRIGGALTATASPRQISGAKGGQAARNSARLRRSQRLREAGPDHAPAPAPAPAAATANSDDCDWKPAAQTPPTPPQPPLPTIPSQPSPPGRRANWPLYTGPVQARPLPPPAARFDSLDCPALPLQQQQQPPSSLFPSLSMTNQQLLAQYRIANEFFTNQRSDFIDMNPSEPPAPLFDEESISGDEPLTPAQPARDPVRGEQML